MSYTLNQSTPSIKLLLETDGQDYGTASRGTFNLNKPIRTPPDTYALIGIERAFWRQPKLFSSLQFPLTVTANGTTANFTSAYGGLDQSYDGSGGYALQGVLNNVISAFSLFFTTNSMTLDVDFVLKINNTNYTWSTSTNQFNLANLFAGANYPAISLKINNTSTVSPVTFTLTDGVTNGFLYTNFGIVTTTQTLAASGSYTFASPLKLNWTGLNYVHVYSNRASGFKTSKPNSTGLQDCSLLAILPAMGTPGDMEYYVGQINEKITLSDQIIDSIDILFTDEVNAEISTISEYSITIGIEFIDVDPPNKPPLMNRKGHTA